jgi:molybdate transport system ATP-binding protein
MEQEIVAVLAEFHGTTVFVSHNRDEVYRVSDKIAIMNSGKIESMGSREDVFDSPKTLAATMMTGCKNISKAEKLDEFRVRAIDWGVDFETDQVVSDTTKYVGLRDHHIQQVPDMISESNVFSCRVLKVIEEPFRRIFVFRFEKGEESASLQFGASKDICGNWGTDEIVLRIPPSKVMCLE